MLSQTNRENIVFLSLGANIGAREQNIRCAIALLEQRVGLCLSCSNFYYSEPWGYVSENEYCNICAKFSTSLDPLDVLKATESIERLLGRKTKGGTYTDRTIDIDILLYNDIHVESARLTIPHPHMNERKFVMEPLKETY